jgi:hypothetical protein
MHGLMMSRDDTVETVPAPTAGSPKASEVVTERAPQPDPTSTGRVTLVSAPALRPGAGEPEDVVAALRFVHQMGTHAQARIAELSASLQALTDALIGDGRLALESYERHRARAVQRETERAELAPTVQLAPVADKYQLSELAEIDCAELVPLCKARCCKLPVTLSAQDLDEHIVRWSYGRPYVLAQRPDGYCVHHASGRCTIYPNRPAGCRVYDCRKDSRVWTDFAARVAAPE